VGGGRTSAGNPEARQLPGQAPPAGDAEFAGRPAKPRRGRAVAAYLVAAAVLFTVYLRLSDTYQLNSDSANILLMGWDLLHGNLLLHAWYMSDVSFYPTELPQYALLESFLGLHPQTAHVAAAMTYTLAFLLAVLLARSGPAGRPALVRTLVAAGIMLAPQLGVGVFALDLSVGHIGTSVPLLLVWLLLDKAPARWYVPVLTAVLLAWVQVADPITYIVGIGPLGLVCAARVVQGLATGTGHWTRRVADRWYELALGAAAVAAAGLAWAANRVLGDLGGYTVNKLPFYFTHLNHLHKNAPAAWKVLQIFGADYAGLSGIQLALAFLHLASVLLVLLAVLLVARRFFSRARPVALVEQVLAVAIVANVALYLLTNASDLAAHEVAIIIPFGAALAARMLVRAGGLARRGSFAGRRARRTAFAAWLLVLAGYTTGLGYDISQPSVPPANTELASWLLAHHLTYGLSGYWTSSSVTVDSGDRVEVRALVKASLKKDLWMSDASWYDSAKHYANFVVTDRQPGSDSYWEPRRLIKKYFGTPARTYHAGPYTIMVWTRNLLNDIPR
jgi:hypothetical protein